MVEVIVVEIQPVDVANPDPVVVVGELAMADFPILVQGLVPLGDQAIGWRPPVLHAGPRGPWRRQPPKGAVHDPHLARSLGQQAR